MALRNSSFVWFCAIFFLFQVTRSEPYDAILSLQTKVETLIENVLQIVHNFYSELKSDNKCLPEEVPDQIMTALKNSIDCLEVTEREHKSLLATRRGQRKSFLKCFSEARKEVLAIMATIDLEKNHCPENITEKTYHINVTTSYTKRFKINIKNGLEVSKVLESSEPDHQLCLDADHLDDEIEDETPNVPKPHAIHAKPWILEEPKENKKPENDHHKTIDHKNVEKDHFHETIDHEYLKNDHHEEPDHKNFENDYHESPEPKNVESDHHETIDHENLENDYHEDHEAPDHKNSESDRESHKAEKEWDIFEEEYANAHDSPFAADSKSEGDRRGNRNYGFDSSPEENLYLDHYRSLKSRSGPVPANRRIFMRNKGTGGERNEGTRFSAHSEDDTNIAPLSFKFPGIQFS